VRRRVGSGSTRERRQAAGVLGAAGVIQVTGKIKNGQDPWPRPKAKTRLLRHEAAINRHWQTSHIGGSVRAEPRYGLANLLGLAKTLEWF
jgi:hypothetical protein